MYSQGRAISLAITTLRRISEHTGRNACATRSVTSLRRRWQRLCWESNQHGPTNAANRGYG